MRTVLLVVIIAIIAIIVAVGTGFLDIRQIRGAKAPQVAASQNGITATGGQAPAFDVETGSVRVGTEDAKVKVPSLEVSRPGNDAAATSNNAM